MPKYVTRMAKSGESESYAIKDKEARELISAEATARESAIAAEATARESAIAAEATARESAIAAEASIREEDISVLDSAFISRGLAFDIFAMYGKTNSQTTPSGITYTWNGQTCTVSGTASGNSFNNFIDIPLPADGISNPPKLTVKTSGNFENVIVQCFTLKDGSIVEARQPDTNGRVVFTDTTANQLLIRLYVANGNTASGSISVQIFNEDIVPFGSHIFDWPEDGANMNDLENGIYLLDSTHTYVNKPPLSGACYVLSYILYNSGLQLAFPYTPQGIVNTSAPVIRSKHVDGTWTEWYPMADFSNNLSKYANDQNVNINDIILPGFYLIHDAYTYTNLPFSGSLGFLIVCKGDSAILQIAIPWDMTSIYMRRRLYEYEWSTWALAGGGNTYNVTNEYNFQEYSQSVTLTATPTITADTNNYLAPTGTTADRTADILAMLTANGICRLGAGDYYVNNLQMPNGSSIIGSGHATNIRLAGTSDGYAIKMGSKCLIENVRITGAESAPSFGTTAGGRHGILWQGDYTQSRTAPERSMVNNVWIENFTGGGITCYDTGYGTSNALEVVNAYIAGCWAGLNISYWSEFHKFTNVRCGQCRIGCVNNGGNNLFVNCDFSSNLEIAMLMDNSQGQSPNNTHGSAVGCVFNHTAHDGESNAGIGIEILNCESGFVFTGCQIFFSQIHLVDSDGIVIADTNFGLNNCNVVIEGGGTVLFSNNMVQGAIPISISENPNVHFVNCYNRSTGAVWSN